MGPDRVDSYVQEFPALGSGMANLNLGGNDEGYSRQVGLLFKTSASKEKEGQQLVPILKCVCWLFYNVTYSYCVSLSSKDKVDHTSVGDRLPFITATVLESAQKEKNGLFVVFFSQCQSE